MTPYQEEGLQKYEEIEAQMGSIESVMIMLANNGESNISLVGDYNRKVDLLDRIVVQYNL